MAPGGPPVLPPTRQPAFRPPEGAWDCHCHVFGPASRFPFAPERTYTPADVPAERLMALHRDLGFARAVLVQPAAHGADHAALRDALARAGGHYRGVMLVKGDGAGIDFAGLHAEGFRGVRYNLVPHLGPPPDAADVRAVAARIAPLGWHIGLHAGPDQLETMDFWLALGLPVILDHIGRLDAAGGADVQTDRLCRLLEAPRFHLKLSAIDRVSRRGAPFLDALPLAQRLFAAAPDRCVWGSDFPHPNHPDVPDDVDLVDAIPAIAPDAPAQRQLLVDTPNRLYA